MAIAYSTQYQALHVTVAGTRQDAPGVYGNLMYIPFDYVNPASGGLATIGDQVYLCKVPETCDIIVPLTYIKFTAWDTNTVIDIGHAAYKTVAGATVAAAEAALINDIDVDAAGWWFGNTTMTSTSTMAHNAGVVNVLQIRAQEPVILTATFRTAAPTASDELHGHFLVSVP